MRKRTAQQIQNFKYNGLTEEGYEILLELQDYRCGICQMLMENATKDGRHFSIDHDHACCSGKSCGKCIRGLLCPNCNAALGMFKDSPVILSSAIRYLERYNGVSYHHMEESFETSNISYVPI